ncbi:hypothetical protein [Micrococcus luteus]|uniref:hypothetical protein n=1 Tax=Micrococcus luteus TaxID=1270 RepID=UPI002AB27EC6|nr:hypothetical protein [Micrococcus luteus]
MSNTATAVMMLPIGVSILVLVQRYGTDGALTGTRQRTRPTARRARIRARRGPTQAEIRSLTKSNFGTALMLGIAYAASIGSLGTIIGTPPNTLLAVTWPPSTVWRSASASGCCRRADRRRAALRVLVPAHPRAVPPGDRRGPRGRDLIATELARLAA